MADTTLRELERRWRESGTVEDEARYLQERVRVGDLSQEKLELAAYLGHEAAARLSTVNALPIPSWRKSPFRRWWNGERAIREVERHVRGVGRWGHQASVRCAVAAANLVRGKWEWPWQDPGMDENWTPDLTLSAVEDWLLQPTTEAAARLAGSLAETPFSHPDVVFTMVVEDPPACASFYTAWTVLWQEAWDGRTEGSPDPPEAHALMAASWTTLGLSEEGQKTVEAVETVEHALRREVVPWALGYGDPVAERVKAQEAASG